jgi:hypothetical protein
MQDVVNLTGRLRLELIRADGNRERREIDNLVVTSGKAVVADRMKAAPAKNAMSNAAVGTGATAPAAGDTTLGAEVAGSRTAVALAVAGAVLTYTASLGPGVGTGALTEAGLFNAAAAGDMLARTTFAVINKAAGDTLNVTWTVTVG